MSSDQEAFPPEFRYLCDVVGLEQYGPWWIPMDTEVRRRKLEVHLELHPGSDLIPFAFCGSNDDVAFFERGARTVVVLDIAEPDWVNDGGRRFPDLRTWMVSLVDEWLGYDIGMKY